MDTEAPLDTLPGPGCLRGTVMKIRNELVAILLVVAMFVVADLTGQAEIIFPEIAALALGAWVMEKSPWPGTDFHFWFSPSLAALTGILIVRYVTYAPFFMITAAFCLVVLQLKLSRSAVLPSISAAILPIITRSESWWYPLSVCVLTGLIALGRVAMNRRTPENDPAAGTFDRGKEKAWSLRERLHWGKLLAGVTLVTAVAVGFDFTFMVAPPLIVAFIELSKPGGVLRDKAGRAFTLLGLAAFSGVSWLYLMHTVFHLPIWISACLSTPTVFLLYHALRLPFPPAVAIALLPAILPEDALLMYPVQVLAGSAGFVVLSKAFFGNGLFVSGRTNEASASEDAS